MTFFIARTFRENYVLQSLELLGWNFAALNVADSSNAVTFTVGQSFTQ